MIIDGQVQIFPARAALVALAGLVAGNSVADAVDPSRFFLISIWIMSPGSSFS